MIDPPSHEALVDRDPGYAAALRKGLQRHASAKDARVVSAMSASRVPQWMLASYLGVSPETISRIRRKLARKPPRHP